jgi:Uncharacterized conserved protein
MAKTFKGRVILAGDTSGSAIVTHQGLNTLASYQKSVLQKAKQVICADQNNPEIYQKNLTDKIICLPQTIGSTTGGMVLQSAINMGIGPRALLFSEMIDSLAVAGVILSEVWNQKLVITIDQLGKEFLDGVHEGDPIEIKEDGTVVVGA